MRKALLAAACLAAGYALRREIAVAAIRTYQRALQPASGCWYDPVCSEYGIRVIRRFGLADGLVLFAIRVDSCTAENRRAFHASHSCTDCARRKHHDC